MIFEEHWVHKGLPIHSIWREGNDIEKFRPYFQTYGICFTRDGKVCVIKHPTKHTDVMKGWLLPGGTPEGNETAQETLLREVNEEATLELEQFKLIGAFEVFFPNNPYPGQPNHLFQLRYVAIIKNIKDQTTDPDSKMNGESWIRKFIEPSEFNNYVTWGKTSEEMFRVAHEHFKNWQKTKKL